jgi:hypothetical protein
MNHIALAVATAVSAHAGPAPHRHPAIPRYRHVVRTTATPRHRHVYLYVRHRVDRRFNKRTAGRNIVRDGMSNGRMSSDRAVVHSTHILERMLAPVSPVTTVTHVIPVAATPIAAAPSSGLEQCIIAHESGGDSTVVNSSGHMGLGQWDEATWLADGGGQYGATPLDATAAEQEQILASEGVSGMESQQAQYDGC